MTTQFLDFERPVEDIQNRLDELRVLKEEGRKDLPVKNLDDEIAELELKQAQILRRIYRNLTPQQRVMVSRHPERPHAIDYIQNLFQHFVPLAGDRLFGEDPAMLAGLATFKGENVVVIGIDKGKTTSERVKKNFGMPKPEGYRKAQRIMRMAEKFGLPIYTFVDTPGAYPGVDAESRGQAEAIASSIELMMNLQVPVVCTISGEGGSGGALGIAVADEVIMLENSIYSVISPEGCASILWKSDDMREAIKQASESLGLTSDHLLKLKVVDAVVQEPVGGAHRDYGLTFKRVDKALVDAMDKAKRTKDNVQSRRQRFL